ncbi:MAG: DNA topoisomerase IB [Candidatus Sumerlaeota bacterium]
MPEILAPEQPSQTPRQTARRARLRYVTDSKPGFKRLSQAGHFVYVDTDGTPIADEAEITRINKLRIPPAWEDVWICPFENGHLQATGRDARGRKQYRYHAKFREARDDTKFHRLVEFGKKLPHIRAAIQKDLAAKGLPKRKVLAIVVTLLETTLIRVGNEEYARQNHSFGLTTLRKNHVEISGARVEFKFRAKSGKNWDVKLTELRLARLIHKCQGLPGRHLFEFLSDDGTPHPVDSADVNEYLQEVTGEDYTAKDFRTWAGTCLALEALQEIESAPSETEAKKNLVHVVEVVAKRLGNTVAVCRKAYIHPALLQGYQSGKLHKHLKSAAKADILPQLKQLRDEERTLLQLLEKL